MLLRRHNLYRKPSVGATPSVETPVKEVIKETVVEETAEETKINKRALLRMPIAELRTLAEKEGIDAEGKSGAELKNLLVEKLGL